MHGLKRVILIDSHMPGVVEMKVDKHTNICGINASGKTTLQRLIMVFYGESPSRVVPKTRDSFEKWYLPRTSSFIVYEYIRESGQTCLVVLSSANDGHSVQYRLINKPFEIEDFIKDRNGNSCKFFTVQQLTKRFSDTKIDRTSPLGNQEYRAVIQNDRTLIQLLAKTKQLKVYTRQFSICENQHSLRHIEKLVGAIHTKNGKMSSIKSMIASILEEDGVVPPSLTLKPNAITHWVKESSAIEELSKHRNKMNKLAHSNDQLIDVENRLIEDVGILTESLLNTKNQLVLLQEKHDELTQNKQNEKDAWQQALEVFFEKITLLKQEIKISEDEVQQINDKYSIYIDSGIEKVKENLNNLDTWRDELKQVSQQLKMLTKDHDDIENSYNDNLTQIKNRENIEIKKYSGDLEKQREKKELLTEKHNLNLRKKEDDDREYKRKQETTFDKLIEEETQQIIDLNAQFKYAALTEDEKVESLIAQNRLGEAQKERTTAASAERDALSKKNNADKKRTEALDSYHSTCKDYESNKLEVSKAEENLNPTKDTLLYYLRNEKHNWVEDIGKVINPKLLQRNDLSPQYIQDNHQSLYGLSLSTNEIEPPEFTENEQHLKNHLIQTENSLDLALKNKEQADKILQEANTYFDTCDKQVLICETQLSKINKNIENIEFDIKDMQDRHQSQLTDRKHLLQEQLSDAKKRKTNKEEEKTNAINELVSTQRQHLNDIKKNNKNIITEINNAIDTTKKRLNKISIDTIKSISEANRLYNTILSEKGIDQESITKLKNKKCELDNTITETENRRGEANTFQEWLSHVYQKNKQTLLNITEHKKQELHRLEHEHDVTETKKNKTLKKIESTIKEHGRKINNSREEIQMISETINRIKKINLVIPNKSNPQFKDTLIKEYIREINERLISFAELTSGLDDDIKYFDRLISKSDDGKISESWERAYNEFNRAEHTYDLHRLVAELQKIFNELIPQNLRTLRDMGQNFGIQINTFYTVLHDIDKKIQGQKKKLTQNINDDLILDGVSDSGIRIFSKISELEYWNDLREFITHHETCSKIGYAEQPSVEYIESIQNVAKLLSNNNRVSLSIIELLDIELYLTEGSSKLTIRTDHELQDSSSHGMAYLILCKYLLAFTNMIRGQSRIPIHWPIDELGTLHVSYIEKIFQACDKNNITIVGALPNPDLNVLNRFKHRYLINKQKRSLCLMESKQSRLMAKVNSVLQPQNISN